MDHNFVNCFLCQLVNCAFISTNVALCLLPTVIIPVNVIVVVVVVVVVVVAVVVIVVIVVVVVIVVIVVTIIAAFNRQLKSSKPRH